MAKLSPSTPAPKPPKTVVQPAPKPLTKDEVQFNYVVVNQQQEQQQH
jgi:hypothetical protein